MNILGSPSRYVQGERAIDQIGELVSRMGHRPLIISDALVWKIVGSRLTDAMTKSRLESTLAEFQGQCSFSEIDRILGLCRRNDCDVIVGTGGGKAIDTAKGLRAGLPLPLVIVPTVAATDAPTSHVSVVYSEDGAFEKVLTLPSNPDLVLVDTGIIAGAPVRYLVAGMGDALSTKFEAEQCFRSGTLNFFGGRPCQAGLSLADACYRLVHENGVLAKRAAEGKTVTSALELVVEANILLSGLGFENCGLAAAHALDHGFSSMSELHGALHGEQVAFGLLVQFVLEKRSQTFMEEILAFYRELDLPTSLRTLGMHDPTEDKIMTIAHHTCQQGSFMYNMAMSIDESIVADAILMADALGSSQLPL
jgi:glycerol dehydrogenase